MKNNKITVFTITYNCGKYIHRCYNTLLNQSYTNWVWLIIDDGSNDNTQDIVISLNDNRISYHKINNNVGRGLARNFGLSKVETEWLAILDMDDLMMSSRLFKFNCSINNGFEGLISSTLLVNNNLKIVGVRDVIYDNYFNLFTHATLCIKTEFLKNISYSSSRYAEDQRVIYLVLKKYTLYKCIEPLYIYQEDASINIRGAFLSNYFAFLNLIKIISLNTFLKMDFKFTLYIIKFGLKSIFLFFISNMFFKNYIYNMLMKKRISKNFQDNTIEQELNLYV